jgi:hypothetical protein
MQSAPTRRFTFRAEDRPIDAPHVCTRYTCLAQQVKADACGLCGCRQYFIRRGSCIWHLTLLQVLGCCAAGSGVSPPQTRQVPNEKGDIAQQAAAEVVAAARRSRDHARRFPADVRSASVGLEPRQTARAA